MSARRGRPKHVDRGTTRRPFTWYGLGGVAGATRYCTVTWMRHGLQVAAAAMYRASDSLDLQYLGMAQGTIDGHLYEIGESGPHCVREVIGRAPERERDWISACVELAVSNLEKTIQQLADSSDSDDVQPWVAGGRALERSMIEARKAEKGGQAKP